MRLYKVEHRLESVNDTEFYMTQNCCDSIQYARTETLVFDYGKRPQRGILAALYWVQNNSLELIP